MIGKLNHIPETFNGASKIRACRSSAKALSSETSFQVTSAINISITKLTTARIMHINGFTFFRWIANIFLDVSDSFLIK